MFGKEQKEYHYNKFKTCENKGIELITLFDWFDEELIANLIVNKTTKPKYNIHNSEYKIEYSTKITNEVQLFVNQYCITKDINTNINTDVIIQKILYQNKIIGIFIYNQAAPTNNFLNLSIIAFNNNYKIDEPHLIIDNILSCTNKDYIIGISNNDLGNGKIYQKLNFKLLNEEKEQLMFYNKSDNVLLNQEMGYNKNTINKDFIQIYNCGFKEWLYIREE